MRLQDIASSIHTHQKFRLLVVVSVLITFIWRFEVELRGWQGLKWLSYYHLAIPFGVGLFATWLALCSNLPSLEKRLKLTGLFLLTFIPIYEILKISIWLFFVGGPSAFVFAAKVGFQLFSMLKFSIFIAYPGILFLFWIAAQRFGLDLDRNIRLLSAGFYLGAWLLAMVLGRFTGVPSDIIHTIKSGNLFLFMTIGLGIPFLAPYRIVHD